MVAQHTPGPWIVTDADGPLVIWSESAGWRVATVPLAAENGTCIDRRDADARLIGAAPELLAALDAMIGLTSQRQCKAADYDRIQGWAREAVAKAGGYRWPAAR